MHAKRILVILLSAVLMSIGVSVAAAQDERLQVVASFSILADAVSSVAGDAADVTSLMPVNTDPHTFTPSPSDLATLADADVVFVSGANFEEGLMEAIENAGTEMNIVEASQCVEIIPIGAAGHNHEGEEDHDHEEGEEHAEEGDMAATEEGAAEEDHDHAEDEAHSDETAMTADSPVAELCAQHYTEMEALHEAGHDHAEDEEHAEEGDMTATEEAHDHEEGEAHSEVETLGALYAIDCGHSHEEEGAEAEEDEAGHSHEEGSCDAHVWGNAHNVMYWAMTVRDTLSELDPANAETYAANAEEYIVMLDELAHDFVRPTLESVPEENRILLTNHETLGYLAASYDYEIVGVVFEGGATAAEPSAAEVAELIDLIAEENVPAVFAETTVSTGLAEQIAADSGAQFYTLYTDSLSDESGPAATYADYIRYNVTTIAEALGGTVTE